MLKDISFGKAITIIGLILVLCGYAECHAKTIYNKVNYCVNSDRLYDYKNK